VIRRLDDYAAVFDGNDDPEVFILAPSPARPVPAGDTRRGTAWIFRAEADAALYAAWVRSRHGIECVPLRVRLRPLADALADRDLTWVLDPAPGPGRFGTTPPLAFKAPLRC